MNRRGAVLALSLGLVALITTLGTTFLVLSLNEGHLGNRSAARQSAFYLAEAGVDRASMNLRTPTDLSDDILTGALSTGTFLVEEQVQLGALRWRARARGTSSENPSVFRRIEVVYDLTPQSVFQWALFGSSKVNVGGSAITDSYDSSLGPYNDDPTSPGYNVSHNGDIGTNSTAFGGVTVGGSIFVDGQVAVGPNVTDPTSLVSGYDPAFITGGTSPPTDSQDVVSQSTPFPMPDVVIPAGCTATLPPLVDGVRTLVSGVDYCPPGDVTINGGEMLSANGPVKVYISGELKINGNATVGVASNPAWMAFLVTSTGSAELQGTITGSSLFYGALYAPKATINISGNAEVSGSIIAKEVNLTGSAVIHYDESLTELTDISNIYRRTLVAWKELD